jgi:hypothetical protein
MAYLRHLPTYMWTLLIAGGCLTVAFAFFFDIENDLAHAGMVMALLVLVILLLFSVWASDHPFQPPTGISAETFKFALRPIQSELSQFQLDADDLPVSKAGDTSHQQWN